MVDHIPPRRPNKKGSQMLVAKRSSACRVLNHNFSPDQRHPTSINNPFIEAPWTPRLVACILLQHAGEIATLSFRTGTGQLFAAPAGARDTGVVIDRHVALPWSEWLFPLMAPCHPIEQHLQDPIHWDSLWNYNTPTNMSPIYQSNIRSVHASHSWKTPKPSDDIPEHLQKPNSSWARCSPIRSLFAIYHSPQQTTSSDPHPPDSSDADPSHDSSEHKSSKPTQSHQASTRQAASSSNTSSTHRSLSLPIGASSSHSRTLASTSSQHKRSLRPPATGPDPKKRPQSYKEAPTLPPTEQAAVAAAAAATAAVASAAATAAASKMDAQSKTYQ